MVGREWDREAIDLVLLFIVGRARAIDGAGSSSSRSESYLRKPIDDESRAQGARSYKTLCFCGKTGIVMSDDPTFSFSLSFLSSRSLFLSVTPLAPLLAFFIYLPLFLRLDRSFVRSFACTKPFSHPSIFSNSSSNGFPRSSERKPATISGTHRTRRILLGL